jgi:hypothetical protein
VKVSAVAVSAAVYAKTRVTSFTGYVLLSCAMPAPSHVWSAGVPCVTTIDAVSASLIEKIFRGFSTDSKLPVRDQRWFTESVSVGLHASA